MDKLVKVYLRDGKEKWLLLHIEIQNQKEAEITEEIKKLPIEQLDRLALDLMGFASIADLTNWLQQQK